MQQKTPTVQVGVKEVTYKFIYLFIYLIYLFVIFIIFDFLILIYLHLIIFYISSSSNFIPNVNANIIISVGSIMYIVYLLS